ncbi:malonate transporter subunit MadL [Cobetia crustatorum]|uniref:Malonate transporter subunit MadL n=1 Tax=Cobetia crustatorum TaxID=553385 RepID=A0A558HKD6_9GAMM|nr:malonate transporter subunit MadL [Cobetia crustatorum]TVU69595.1 malonate transporter subunit MadL [Cobetia crustatorum]
MVIYGVALLAGCMMAGLVIGDMLGEILNIDSNLGGVGIAMLLLIFITGVLKERGKMADSTSSGINFWNAMYIPIVVAMAASQNVAAAFSGGMVALVAGVLAVVLGLALVPILTGKRPETALDDAADDGYTPTKTSVTTGAAVLDRSRHATPATNTTPTHRQ